MFPVAVEDFDLLNLGCGVDHSDEMTGVGGFFTDFYKSVAEEINRETFENFKNTSSDFDKIKILYPYCKDMAIEEHKLGKDYDKAIKEKNKGNSFFAKHEVYQAIKCYGVGIVNCPSKPGESLKLLTVLIANRSACLFELGEYEKTLDDITYALSFEAYPEELKHKVFLRQAKCYSNIEKTRHRASDAYRMALHYLDQSNLNPKAMAEKQLEINEALAELETWLPPPDTIVEPQLKPFIPHVLYGNASSAITFDKEETSGRFAYAREDIETGTIIIDEPAYCAVVAEDFALTNCQHCMIATDTPIACPDCANVVFCSLKCKLEAFAYHRRECGLHPILFSSGASINCAMALRIITQRNLDFFEGISGETPSKRRIIFDGLCGIDHDYYGVRRLCRNEGKRTNEEYVQYTIMAIFLLKLLKTTSFFDVQDDDVLTITETFIGSLILRHLQALQFNAHEISQLSETPHAEPRHKDEPNFKAMFVGGGLYTTLAMFNHSCDPSIVRYNVGQKMIVKTIKPHKKGTIIYENYGPIYTSTPREERRAFLSDRYWFSCDCQACKEDWPEFINMIDKEMKIPCVTKRCNNFFSVDEKLQCHALKCRKCHKITNLLPHFIALPAVVGILSQAEVCYKNKQYKEATEHYLEAMKIYSKHTVPPFPDWVQVQQRLRTCFITEGNKSIQYSQVRADLK